MIEDVFEFLQEGVTPCHAAATAAAMAGMASGARDLADSPVFCVSSFSAISGAHQAGRCAREAIGTYRGSTATASPVFYHIAAVICAGHA